MWNYRFTRGLFDLSINLHLGGFMNIYQENGYENRRDYLENLALDYGIEKTEVFTIASLLGRDEDFDGLVSMVDDYANRLINLEG